MTESRTTVGDIRRLMRPQARDLPDYGGPIYWETAAEPGEAPSPPAKLDANENPYGPSPAVREALAACQSYHRYPDPQQRRLRPALAEYVGVGPENIVAGAGADELIDLLFDLFVEPGEEVIISAPTFGMYEFFGRLRGARVRPVPRGPGFSLEVEAIGRAVSVRTKLIFLGSPNNPTGDPVEPDQLRALLALGPVVVLDEAYVEFSGGSFAPLVRGHENLAVLRTFSKWAALAALRAGFAVVSGPVAERLLVIKPPFNVSAAAEEAMLASLRNREALMANVRTLVEERERMRAGLARLPFLEPWPSQANFFLCRVRGADGHEVRDRLRERGVLVRFYDRPGLEDYVRISAGRPEDTERLVAAFTAVGKELGLG